MNLTSFKELVKQYKVIFFDAYGVLKTHKGVLPGVKETLQYLDDNNIDYYVLTNDASRSRRLLAKGYQDAGIAEITHHKFITSGMLAQSYLQRKIKEGTIAYLGTYNSAHYIEKAGLKPISIADVTPEHYDDIKALVFLDDEGYNWNEDINRALNLLRKTPIPAIVANTDATYPVANKEVAVSVGAIADMLEKLARRTFIRFGKPDSEIFNFAYNYAVQEDHAHKHEILMVGDSLSTDIIGGNKFGIDTALVLSGNILPERAELHIASTGITPDYICESISFQ